MVTDWWPVLSDNVPLLGPPCPPVPVRSSIDRRRMHCPVLPPCRESKDSWISTRTPSKYPCWVHQEAFFFNLLGYIKDPTPGSLGTYSSGAQSSLESYHSFRWVKGRGGCCRTTTQWAQQKEALFLWPLNFKFTQSKSFPWSHHTKPYLEDDVFTTF